MTADFKKGTGISTGSSSASTSGSSSSSSSSSGSGSSSSSESDSSSSQGSAKRNSSSESKKASQSQPTVKVTKKSENPSKAPSSKTLDTKSASLKPKPTTSKVLKASPIEISSSDVDEGSSKEPPKKKSSVKAKSSATVTPKQSVSKPQSSAKPVPKASSSKTGALKSKEAKISKKTDVKNSNSKNDANKKKSIFSPENSSESDSKETKPQSKSPQKARPKAAAMVIEKAKPHPKKVDKRHDKPILKSKEAMSSAESSVATSSTDTSSSSDSDSSLSESAAARKAVKKPVTKAKVTPKDMIANSDTENECQDSKVTRKLTRSSNTRKSKHVLGKNVYSDTDSDTESTKRSLSRSPVKRAPVTTKGKTKNKRPDAKSRASEILIKEERRCPLEGCDTLGHLSGKLDKHFTLEACPAYHNLTPAQCKEECVERKKRDEIRKKYLDMYKKSPKAQILQEQKQNLLKIKEARSKFKFEPSEVVKHVDKSREPILTNFVPEYDLKLFMDAQAVASEKIEEELKTQPNTKGTKYIEMGKFEMEVWYQSPYPEDYARLPKLYICEFCLRYMKSRTILLRHVVKCVWRHPPGEEVYRKDKISVWEVDGKRYKQYCQNLCLLAKFFLDHKTLYYDVEPFLFYVMTMYDSEGCHTVGYFSKEKNSFLNYNVSCILTLPPYQRQGYGRLLIDFSYLLTRVEGKIGSPEKPLSDLGLISYRSYWKDVLLGYLCANSSSQLSVKDISQDMAIHSYDIVSTLQALGMMKYWKGKHIILKKQDVLDEYVERVKRRGSLLKEVDPACLRWIPPQPASA